MECLRVLYRGINIPLSLLWDHRLGDDDLTYTGMDIYSKIIVSTTLVDNGNVVRKHSFKNSFKKLE